MHSSDFVYLDVRWREDGWLEAMRLRLTGWLPELLVAQGVDKGVFQVVQKPGGTRIVLTARGTALTEPGPHSFTSENCWQLAQVLKMQDDGEYWLEAPSQEAIQYVHAPLNATYRTSLLKFLRSAFTTDDT